MTPVDDLTPQQTRVLADLLAGETVSAAARNHGVHRATVHNWIRADLRFRAALDQGRARLQSALFDTVQELAVLALDRVRHILEDPNASPSVQLRAAAIVLKLAKPSVPDAAIRETVEADQMIQHVMDNQQFREQRETRQSSTPENANGPFRYGAPPPGNRHPEPPDQRRPPQTE